MVKIIDKQINELPSNRRKEFEETLEVIMQDYYWQTLRGWKMLMSRL